MVVGRFENGGARGHEDCLRGSDSRTTVSSECRLRQVLVRDKVKLRRISGSERSDDKMTVPRSKMTKISYIS